MKVFPVVFHVDYWDGLGWPDRFARVAYTQRQQAYARALSQNSVYTPEFIVGGSEWKAWFKGNREPRAAAPTTGILSIEVKSGDNQVSGTYIRTPQISGSATYALNVALLGMNIHSAVRGGENGGRELIHDFIVLDFKTVPLSQENHFQSGSIKLEPSTDDRPGALVAWVTSSEGGIVQVVGGFLPNSDVTADK